MKKLSSGRYIQAQTKYPSGLFKIPVKLPGRAKPDPVKSEKIVPKTNTNPYDSIYDFTKESNDNNNLQNSQENHLLPPKDIPKPQLSDIFTTWENYLQYFLNPFFGQEEISNTISILNSNKVPVKDRKNLEPSMLSALGISTYVSHRIVAVKNKVT